MGESTKAVCALVLIVAVIGAVFAWMADTPSASVWAFRIGSPTLAALAVGLIMKLQFRSDIAPDLLRQQVGDYFNRGGFCFAIRSTATEGVAYMDAYFQNQYDNECLGRIAVRPARGFFLNRAQIATVTYEIACGPAAFGVARIPLGIPKELQGRRQSFEVGASVEYPDGQGRRLRFRDGCFLRANTKFADNFRTALILASAATGQIFYSSPTSMKVELPQGVAEDVPAALQPTIRTLWRWGNPLPNDESATS